MERGFLPGLGKKAVLTFFVLFLALLFRFLPLEIPILDQKGDKYFDEAIKKAAVTYGVVRLTNALVSVAKETEVEVLVGLGITIPVGQLLDPIDDATERLSSVLTVSIAMLGVMKVAKELLSFYAFKLLSYLLPLLIPGIWIRSLTNFSRNLLGLIVLIFLLRLSLPLCGVVNDFIYRDFFEPQIKSSLQTFSIVNEHKNRLLIDVWVAQDSLPEGVEGDFSLDVQEDSGGFLSSLKGYFSKILSYLENAKSWIGSAFELLDEKKKELLALFKSLWEYKDELVGAITSLIVVYISLVAIQVLLIPLAVVWFLKQLASSLLRL